MACQAETAHLCSSFLTLDETTFNNISPLRSGQSAGPRAASRSRPRSKGQATLFWWQGERVRPAVEAPGRSYGTIRC
eukprot:5358088-Prymnesium_polylepis.1